jgi:hypothetical protein
MVKFKLKLLERDKYYINIYICIKINYIFTKLFYQGLQPKVKIIGAAYGSADVTEKVNEIY